MSNEVGSGIDEVSVASLLQSWRQKQTSFKQETAAPCIGVVRSTLANWEADRGSPSLEHVSNLDALYGADGVLTELFQAVRSPEALPARRIWAHNFTWQDSSVWAWVRLSDPSTPTSVTLRWGAFKTEWTGVVGSSGVVFTSPVAIANPAVWIELGSPGWVDFGRGVVPDEIGLPLVDVLEEAQFLKERQHLLLLVKGAAWLRPKLGKARPAIERTISSATARLQQIGSEKDTWGDYLEVPEAVEKWRPTVNPEISLATVRDARGTSSREVAEAATNLMPESRLTHDQVERIEKGLGVRAKFPLARLDAVYRTDGALGFEEVDDFLQIRGVDDRAIRFPKFWIGPVWIAFQLPSGNHDEATLIWGPWQKRLGLRGPTVVTCRKATLDAPPLIVRCSPSYKVRAGVGSHPLAHDVNSDWAPSSESSLNELSHMYASASWRMKGVADRLLSRSSGR